MVLVVKIPEDTALPLTEEIVDSVRGDAIPSYLEIGSSGDAVVDTSVLIRYSENSPGLYAYSISSTSFSKRDIPNVRATTLAMACGLHSKRFIGDVYIGRLGYTTASGLGNIDVTAKDICQAVHTPDLRESFVQEMVPTSLSDETSVNTPPDWLCSGAQRNYHDNKSMAALASAMTRDVANSDDESCSTSEPVSDNELVECLSTNVDERVGSNKTTPAIKCEATYCLHCRRPATTLCNNCNAAYFCEEPRKCKDIGWSHQCLCATWKLYVEHRQALSHFPFFSGWQLPLLQEDCFSSDEKYKQFLGNTLNVINAADYDPASPAPSWWSTEIHGWSGGKSASAKLVNLFQRVSYNDGFGLDLRLIPDESPINSNAFPRAGISLDQNNMPILSSWEDYYNLRSLPPSSPVALIATFPLTVYYAIQRHGTVPVTVAKMLDRPMRIHLIGIEKETNFIDFFRELGFLLPEQVRIEMSWIIREDMFPESSNTGSSTSSSALLSLQLTDNTKLSIIGGTYGDSLDPNFDLAGGAPDMIIGLNAGLYAYESWRHVVSYLDNNPNIVGVFTDYNEYSGMNCASLGGSKAWQSLHINPFRQPRAMPVNCMNLPQFSNGFMYVFNEQELD
jgi:hypothetical protein